MNAAFQVSSTKAKEVIVLPLSQPVIAKEASIVAESEPAFAWRESLSSEASAQPNAVYRRQLGPTEVSYYLGSRGDGGHESGVNDMYLHLGFKALPSLLQPERLLAVWTELLARHTLLASAVHFHDYEHIDFVYTAPIAAAEARRKAQSQMELRCGQDRDDVLTSYLNGPRTLSDSRLAYLVISTSEPELNRDDREQDFDFWLFSTHFIGDGMALHATANEFFTLLSQSDGSGNKNIEKVRAEQGLGVESHAEQLVWTVQKERLPEALESTLLTNPQWGKLAWTSAKVDFETQQRRLIGGQAFQRVGGRQRKTQVPTISYPSASTKKILANCKAHGTTIAHAAFALCNVAFALSSEERHHKEDPQHLPCMLYSALNVRPYLKSKGDWYHLAVGYYNIILPSFLPRNLTLSQIFWHRATSVKEQTTKAIKSKWLVSRTELMALERQKRSIQFEKADDKKRADKAAGFAAPSPSAEKKTAQPTKAQSVPSTALMGLSMLGNLDGIYKHAQYQDIQLNALTTGSRQRRGAILLFAYTFAGRLWFSLGYDANGFADGEVENFWDRFQRCVDELLIS